MRKLVVLAAFAVLLLAVDQGARVLAESQLASRSQEAGEARSAEATITAFPFLGRLLASGSVPRVRVRVEGAQAGPVPLAAVVVQGDGVVVNRRSLLSGDVRLEDIDRGLVAVEIDGPALTDVLKVPVRVAGGEVHVEGAAGALRAQVEVRDGALVLGVAGLRTLELPVVRMPLVPCAAASVTVEGDVVRLACELDELPAAVRRG